VSALFWVHHHRNTIDFWRLMLRGCWLVYPCMAIPDWVWFA
jgi:hypothetical protein